ncbi:YaiI/YqxD family protein [Litoricolaceae bacterium]|nr:YaiI/YqxD family protein [Litorivicinaceae bacterium]MDB2424693.1 YaiI/YqxD family protein [Litorivicinaceae bacterium]
MSLTIWVDADACPKPIKSLIYRASDRLKVPVFLVANGFLQKPPHPLVSVVQVSKGFDVADNVILERLTEGDLVVTQDVPLAAEVVDQGGFAVNPRGTWYDKESVNAYLRRRNEREEKREAGLVQGGPAPFGPRETQQFARVFDQFLARVRL